MITPADLHTASILRQHGIKMSVACVTAAKKAKLPLPHAAALLMMETGGGANVFGHDPTIFVGGAVTRQRWLAYVAERKRTGKMQGAGPTQLTWYRYQDEADRLGGGWKPDVNMQVGFSILRAHISKFGVEKGFAAYNGSGPAATAYGKKAAGLVSKFAVALTPKPKSKAVLKLTAPVKKAVKKVTKPWWTQYVTGDTDCESALILALANVARDYSKAHKLPVVIRIRCGTRSYAEQLALYRLYLAGKGNLAAKPGMSNHEAHPPAKRGRAADCGIRIGNRAEENIGAEAGVRMLMRRHGLCLPVHGENWHVERGSAWNA